METQEQTTALPLEELVSQMKGPLRDMEQTMDLIMDYALLHAKEIVGRDRVRLIRVFHRLIDLMEDAHTIYRMLPSSAENDDETS